MSRLQIVNQMRHRKLAEQSRKALSSLAEQCIRLIQAGADPHISFEIYQLAWFKYIDSKHGMPIGFRKEAFHTIMDRALPACKFPRPEDEKRPGFFKKLMQKLRLA